jgi:hypothetical protein
MSPRPPKQPRRKRRRRRRPLERRRTPKRSPLWKMRQQAVGSETLVVFPTLIILLV